MAQDSWLDAAHLTRQRLPDIDPPCLIEAWYYVDTSRGRRVYICTPYGV